MWSKVGLILLAVDTPRANPEVGVALHAISPTGEIPMLLPRTSACGYVVDMIRTSRRHQVSIILI